MRREFRRCIARYRLRHNRGQGRILAPWMLTMAAAVVVVLVCVAVLEARLRPMVVLAAQAQAQNAITAVAEETVVEDLAERGVTYDDFVTIQRDASGAITALTTDMAAMNLLRAQLVADVLEALEGVDVSQIQVPLGSLVDLDILWGLGPTLKVHAMTVGTVDGEFFSEFTSAGVNQTLHRICLKLTVPLTLMLPGGAVETVSETELCVAETVIVGQVPQAYLDAGQ